MIEAIETDETKLMRDEILEGLEQTDMCGSLLNKLKFNHIGEEYDATTIKSHRLAASIPKNSNNIELSPLQLKC